MALCTTNTRNPLRINSQTPTVTKRTKKRFRERKWTDNTGKERNRGRKEQREALEKSTKGKNGRKAVPALWRVQILFIEKI